MAKSKAIQDLLKEWYNSDVTGDVDANPERQDSVISEIPSSLMAYLSAIVRAFFCHLLQTVRH